MNKEKIQFLEAELFRFIRINSIKICAREVYTGDASETKALHLN